MNVRLALACVLLIPTLAAADQVYKWVDDQGHVHYSSTPPPSTKAQQMTVNVPPPDPQSLQNSQQLQQSQADKDKAAQAAAAKNKPDPAAATQKKQHCDDLNSRLVALQMGGRAATVDAQGNRSYISDDDRAKQVQQLQGQIAKDCGSNP